MTEFSKFKLLISDLSMDFTIYHQLFSKEKDIEVLNKFNYIIFSNYQKCLLESIYSKISRLLDPAKTHNNKNLSFSYFIEKFSLSDDKEIMDKLDEIEKVYKETNLKKYRDKVLSHNDVKLATAESVFKLDLTINEVNLFLSSLRDLCCLIDYKSGGSELRYSISPYITLPRDLDGSSFIRGLKAAYDKPFKRKI